jgi:hypothetical protein
MQCGILFAAYASAKDEVYFLEVVAFGQNYACEGALS